MKNGHSFEALNLLTIFLTGLTPWDSSRTSEIPAASWLCTFQLFAIIHADVEIDFSSIHTAEEMLGNRQGVQDLVEFKKVLTARLNIETLGEISIWDFVAQAIDVKSYIDLSNETRLDYYVTAFCTYCIDEYLQQDAIGSPPTEYLWMTFFYVDEVTWIDEFLLRQETWNWFVRNFQYFDEPLQDAVAFVIELMNKNEPLQTETLGKLRVSIDAKDWKDWEVLISAL